MADNEEIKDEKASGETGKDQPDGDKKDEKELTPEQKQIAELTAKIDEIGKKAQSENDRLRTEKKTLEKRLEETEKEKMTAKEKAEFEQKKKDEELAAREREIEEKSIALIKRDVLDAAGLPVKLKDHISGSTEEQIKKSATVLKEYINELVTEGVEKRFKTPPPPPKDTTETKIATGNGSWKDELKSALT